MNSSTFKKAFDQYKAKRIKSQKFFKNAATISCSEIKTAAQELRKSPDAAQIINFIKTFTSSGGWISHSSARLLLSLIDFTDANISEEQSKRDKLILSHVAKKLPLSKDDVSNAEIFDVIYRDIEYSHHNPSYKSPLKCPSISPTIVLVSGVLNEIFSTAAFERGAKHLSELYGLKYITPKVNGTKSSFYNSKLLYTQIQEYIQENPNQKLWIIAFSKGGIDALHFLKDYPDIAHTYVTGLSTIASPILGSPHVNHRIIQMLNSIGHFADEKISKVVGSDKDVFGRGIQVSLSQKYRKPWFERNHKKLPTDIFYSSLALYSKWYQSHLWMILTKILFQSRGLNDGVVDVDHAHFPHYFESVNLGEQKGHHLIGTRSSFFSQEALLEAHIILLNYLGLI